MTPVLTLTVCVCTRNRTGTLARCLASLERLFPAPDAVIVADQSDDGQAKRVRELCGDRFGYLPVAPKGLGFSRQAALERIHTDILAFTDDDCIAQPPWVGALLDTFRRHPQAGAVTGATRPDPSMPLPPGVDAWVSDWGHPEERVFRSPHDPSDIGGGLNMAFSVRAIRDVGGFDPLLGPGAPLRNADDADALHRLLLAGRPVVYTPSAVVSHQPPRDHVEQAANDRSYAIGLGAWAEYRRGRGDAIPLTFWRSTLIRTLALMIRRAPFDGPRRTGHRARIAWDLLQGRRLPRRLLDASGRLRAGLPG